MLELQLPQQNPNRVGLAKSFRRAAITMVGALGLLTPFVSQAAPPAAPTGLTLCVGGEAECAPPPQSGGGSVKWNPGHYLLAGYARKNFPEIENRKHFKGAKVEYNWADLEPNKGDYDFSGVERTLQALQKDGKRLFLTVRYKTFNTHARSRACAPSDLHNNNGTILKLDESDLINGQDPRCTAAVWREHVANRLIELVRALGERFDKEPNFEGIIFPETALGLGNLDIPDLTSASYVKQLKRIMSAAKEAFPNSVVYQHGNWINGNQPAMDELMAHAHAIGIGFGGPDLMPNRHTLSTKRHKDYKGKMPLSIDNQRATRVSGSSVERAYQYAVNDPDGLHANHIFWSSRASSPWDFEANIAPVVEGHNGKINTGCPANLNCK